MAISEKATYFALLLQEKPIPPPGTPQRRRDGRPCPPLRSPCRMIKAGVRQNKPDPASKIEPFCKAALSPF